VFLFSCSPDHEEKHESGYRLSADNSIMALHWKMYQTMAANPGMAEQIGYRCLRLAEIWKLPRREFNAWMALAELYQYYKPDFGKSVRCLTEAMKVYATNRGNIDLDSPYAFINIGNMFNNFGYYPQARMFYDYAIKYGGQIHVSHVCYLGFFNKATSFHLERKSDSAFLSLSCSYKYIIPSTDFITAQNDNLRAEIYLDNGNRRSAQLVLQHALSILDAYRHSDLEMKLPGRNRKKIEWETIAWKTHALLCRIYDRDGREDSCLLHLGKALELANDLRNNGTVQAGMCLLNLTAGCTRLSDDSVSGYAEKMADRVNRSGNLTLIHHFHDSILHIFSAKGNSRLNEKFRLRLQEKADSLENARIVITTGERDLLAATLEANTFLLQKQHDLRDRKLWNYIGLGSLAMTILITGIFAWFYSRVHKWRTAYRQISDRLQQILSRSFPGSAGQNLNPELMEKLEKQLERLMQEDAPYLNPDLTIDDLAQRLATNATYLSRLLNKTFRVNFNDYINRYRVEEASSLLRDPSTRKLSMIQLAERSGFKSKSTFYRVFNKMKGVSPIAYQKTLEEETQNHS
jgi:AraC-like DNA-binding protein